MDDKVNSTDLKDQLRDCTHNLFSEPTNNINNAFNIILQMINKQECEHDKVKMDQEKLWKNYTTMNESLHLEIEKSHESLRVECEENKKVIQELKSDNEKLHEEKKVLADTNASLSNSLQKVLTDIDEVKEQIRVITFNFQGYDHSEEKNSKNKCMKDYKAKSDTEDVAENSQQDSESNTEDSAELQLKDNQTNANEKHTSTPPPSLNDENKTIIATENSENSHQKQSQESESNAKLSLVTDGIDNSESNTPSNDSQIIEPLPVEKKKGIDQKRSIRRLSIVNVAKQRLETHETFAVRLQNLEESKEKMEKLLQEMKESHSETQCVEKEVPINSEPNLNNLDELVSRLSTVEEFLLGFGVIESNESTSLDNNANEKSSNSLGEKTEPCEDKTLSPGILMKDTSLKDRNDEKSINMEIMTQCDNNKQDTQSSETIVPKEEKPVEKKKDEDENSIRLSKLPFELKNARLWSHLSEQEEKRKQDFEVLSDRIKCIQKEDLPSFDINTINTEIDNLRKDLLEIKKKIEDEREFTNDHNDLNDDEKLKTLLQQQFQLNEKLVSISDSMNDKVSKDSLKENFSALIGSVTDKPVEFNDENSKMINGYRVELNDFLNRLEQCKLDKQVFNDEIEEFHELSTKAVEQKLTDQKRSLLDTIENIEQKVVFLTEGFANLENKASDRIEDIDEAGQISARDIEARIKEATNAMNIFVEETIQNRLEVLVVMESELNKLTSQLADTPDQDQISKMLFDLESSLSQRFKNDNTLKGMVDNFKTGNS